jgi:hypothetical protein
MFDYDPKDATDCLPEGEYDAELHSVKEKVSKKGNPMLEVEWVIDHGGRQWTVRDYIVSPSGIYKLKMIARAWQALGEFENRSFDLAKRVGQMARLRLQIDQQEGFADKNVIAHVGPASFEPNPAQERRGTDLAHAGARQKDDEIPF